MQRMLRRGGLFALITVFGLALVMGGCQADKKKAAAAEAEAAELRTQNASLQQANQDMGTRLAEMEARMNQGGGGMDDSTPGTPHAKRGGNNNGDRMITRSKETGLPTATIGGDVLFGSGSDTIKPEAKKVLDKIASEIKSQYSGASIRVEGYTDSDPIKKSKWGTNEKLSQIGRAH